MASVAFARVMSPDIINLINNDISDINISKKKMYFKKVHNQLVYTFMHAIHWLEDYPKNYISNYAMVLTMLKIGMENPLKLLPIVGEVLAPVSLDVAITMLL
jgi:hypothetical protein